jgi:hypothetical protein
MFSKLFHLQESCFRAAGRGDVVCRVRLSSSSPAAQLVEVEAVARRGEIDGSGKAVELAGLSALRVRDDRRIV